MSIYPIYIVNTEEKTYEEIWCNTFAEREQVANAVYLMSELFYISNVVIKYVEPEFEEVE